MDLISAPKGLLTNVPLRQSLTLCITDGFPMLKLSRTKTKTRFDYLTNIQWVSGSVVWWYSIWDANSAIGVQFPSSAKDNVMLTKPT